MNKKQKKILYRIAASAVLFAVALFLRTYLHFSLLLVSYLIIGYDILYKAFQNILRGDIFDENFLMSIATVGAMIIGEYPEAVFVMLFYQVGELFQSVAVGKSRRSISTLMAIRPDSADIERDGEIVTVDPYEVAVGDVMVVRPGEKIALDGVITEGETSVDTRALTGESMPCDCSVGDSVISGSVNVNGVIKVRVTKEFSDSTVSKILEFVENSGINKAKSEKFITRFARVYTPAVMLLALLLALLPPLFIGISTLSVWSEWVYRALTFLVISCPCALVISVPLSFFGGIGGLSKKGILVKGSNYVEALANCKTVVFDKTGTLTAGDFKIDKVCPVNCSEDELLLLASVAESISNHPIAAAFKNSAAPLVDGEELSGQGVRVRYNGKDIYAGNAKLMQKIGAEFVSTDETAVHIASGDTYKGYITLTDTVKSDAKDAIIELKRMGVKDVVMLTGDKKDTAQKVANSLGITDVYAQLLPCDKVEITEKLIDACHGTLAFVGDGINDAPVLARADVGIAMGALGSDAAIEAADIVLMDDNIKKVAESIKTSRFIVRIVKQNVAFIFAVKALVLICGALGLTGMWSAVFADVGVAIIAILNSMRTLKNRG